MTNTNTLVSLIYRISFYVVAAFLSLYVLIISFIPFLYWVMDGGLTLGLWLLLALYILWGIWQIVLHNVTTLGWVWLGGFFLFHLMLYTVPAIWSPWAEDGCLDAGGRWHEQICLME
jgi:hypothetical protein